MYTITVQDVESVVAELTGQSGARDGFLYALLRKTVFLSVRGKCRSTPCLYGKGLEEDILHDIYIKVWTHAYRILFQNGPRGRNASDVATLKSLIVSPNIVAIDTAALSLFNQVKKLDLAAASHIGKGEAQHLGTTDLKSLNIKRIKL